MSRTKDERKEEEERGGGRGRMNKKGKERKSIYIALFYQASQSAQESLCLRERTLTCFMLVFYMHVHVYNLSICA